MSEDLSALSHEQWTDLYNAAEPETRFLIFLQRVIDSPHVALGDGLPAVGSLVGWDWVTGDRASEQVARVTGDGGAVVVEYLPDGRAVLCTEDGSFLAAEV